MIEAVSVEDVALPHGTARVLTLQRPDERNPLDHATVARLRALAEDADADSGGARRDRHRRGPRVLRRRRPARVPRHVPEHEQAFRAFLDEFRALNARLEHGRFVSIAMVNGACVAGGLELALACDLITIADDARIGDGHLGTGQIDGAGGSQRLVRALGVQRAKQLLLTGRLWTGRRSRRRRAGACSACPAASCATRTLELAAELARPQPARGEAHEDPGRATPRTSASRRRSPPSRTSSPATRPEPRRQGGPARVPRAPGAALHRSVAAHSSGSVAAVCPDRVEATRRSASDDLRDRSLRSAARRRRRPGAPS